MSIPLFDPRRSHSSVLQSLSMTQGLSSFFLLHAISLVRPRRRLSSAPTAARPGRRAQGVSRLAALQRPPEGSALTRPSTTARSCERGLTTSFVSRLARDRSPPPGAAFSSRSRFKLAASWPSKARRRNVPTRSQDVPPEERNRAVPTAHQVRRRPRSRSAFPRSSGPLVAGPCGAV
jgi:hypothetical protein